MLTVAGIIMGIIMGIITGGIAYLCACGTFRVEQRWKRWLISIIVCGIFFTIAAFGYSAEEVQYNNGNCVYCGEKYKAIEHRHSSTYYECPNCRFGTWW